MATLISNKHSRDIIVLIRDAFAKHKQSINPNNIRILTDTDVDDNDIIHIVLIKTSAEDILPYELSRAIAASVIAYLNANGMHHIPVSHHLYQHEWEATRERQPNELAIPH